MPSTRPDFYQDARWCLRCQGYVPYLTSPHGAFCVHCDSGVHLFSPDDRQAFRQGHNRCQWMRWRAAYKNADLKRYIFFIGFILMNTNTAMQLIV